MGDFMSSVIISGDTSGAITLAAPSVAGTNTITLPANTGTVITTASSAVVTPTMLSQPLTSGTAVASTSGTSIDFTSIPSWVKRITVMFNAVSTNGTSNLQIQIGAGSVITTGYTSSAWTSNTTNTGTINSGFILTGTNSSTATFYGNISICLFGSNTWVESHSLGGSPTGFNSVGGGTIALGGTLDRVRITTVNGTDTFDAGSINILYE
jgi:hypothetical protein